MVSRRSQDDETPNDCLLKRLILLAIRGYLR